MKKSTIITTIVFFFLFFSLFLPNSPIFKPLIIYLENRVEARWACEVTNRRAAVDLLKQSLVLSDLDVKTGSDSNPNWHLSVKRAVLKLDYRSLIRGKWLLDTLFLKDISFTQEERERSKKNAVNGRLDTTEPDVTRQKDGEPVKPVNIKQLIVLNGSFEFSFIHASGVTDRIAAENIHIRKKEVFFDGNPDRFFRSMITERSRVLP